MKNIVHGLLFISCLASFESEVSAQHFSDPGPMVSVYVGTDWYKTIYQASYPDSLNMNNYQRFEITNISSTGSWGGKVEQMLTRRFGVAVDFWYAQTNVSAICYRRVDSSAYIDPITGNFVYPKNPYGEESAYFSKRLSRLNVTLRFDLHLGRSQKVDPYFHFAFGGALSNLFFTSSNTSVYSEENFYIPVAVKLGTGIRVFVSNHIGLYTEMSIGGPLIVGGASYKFYKEKEREW